MKLVAYIWNMTGKVQGVCFRSFARQNASKLNLMGYVKNLSNGSVEILVQGDELKIKMFRIQCKQGPMFAKVDNISEQSVDTDPDLEIFDIR